MSKHRLSALKPRLATLAPRVGYTPGNEQQRNRYRDNTQRHRGWYKTSRWQTLRWSVLTRDLWTCQICKRIIVEKGKAIADHIIPHRGKAELFWDARNLQCLCAECHDTVKQAEDKAIR